MNKILRKLASGLSLTSALFIFQACYGSPQDMDADIFIEGQVKSKVSGLPVQGIKVSVEESAQFQFTDNDGRFSLYTGIHDSYKLMFEDTDSVNNGHFADKDTVIFYSDKNYFLDIALDPK
jgi:hypothetical protein